MATKRAAPSGAQSHIVDQVHEADIEKAAKRVPMTEIGSSGLKVWSGYVNEEFLKELRGARGVAVFQEMASNDANIGAALRAITLMLRGVEWDVEPVDATPAAKQEAEFVLSLFDDMSHPFADVIDEALSMLWFGWAYHEIVLKRRVGPAETDPAKRSKYDDGRIGLRKLPIRSQDSLVAWVMQEDGGIAGMRQLPPQGGAERFIPIERAILFRTTSRKNNPEGVSILRNAYRSWYFLKIIEEVEAIGIERELAGLPVVRIPAKVLNSTDAADMAIVAAYKTMARDVKLNEQGAVLIPSDPYMDKEGNPTALRQVEISLMTTGGARAIDTNIVATRHQQNMLRSILSQFLMLGSSSVGSFALNEGQTDLFMESCEAILDSIEDPINRFLLPRLWEYNGLDNKLMPRVKHGKVAPENLERLGNWFRNLLLTGLLTPDPELEVWARKVGGMPPMSSAGDAGHRDQRQDQPGAPGERPGEPGDDEEGDSARQPPGRRLNGSGKPAEA